ncbi:MAG TPA: YkgJ family cysteine cluster protein [Bryobacteraceae bacterium]|nr:YkgJ family cysteine cluster protein [Bryobacteraceae bacterium]
MPADRDLVQIIDAALAEAARKSGSWLLCRPGCTECCIGPFPITQLDARRLREGLAELESRDPQRANRVRRRAREAVARMPDYPGDRITGTLDDSLEGEERFNTLAEEDPCPALDPETGTCDLYAARPVTCRTFGPAFRWGSRMIGICELCYRGATEEEIAACAAEVNAGDLEAELVADEERVTGVSGETIVAFALSGECLFS